MVSVTQLPYKHSINGRNVKSYKRKADIDKLQCAMCIKVL